MSTATAPKAKAADKEFDPVNLDPKWVESLPEYRGPSNVRALQIQHVENYGDGGAPTDKKGNKVIKHMSLAGASALGTRESAIPATARVQPEDFGEHAAARITPADKSYPAFEVDEAYMLECRPHTGGYYVVYESGVEGFEPPEVFRQKYTLIENPEEAKALAEQDKQRAEQAKEEAELKLKQAEKVDDVYAANLAKEQLKNATDGVKAAGKAASKPAAKAAKPAKAAKAAKGARKK